MKTKTQGRIREDENKNNNERILLGICQKHYLIKSGTIVRKPEKPKRSA